MIETYTASSDISDPSTLNYIIKGLHNFRSRCVAIESVGLQNVDIRPQSLNTLINSVKNMLSSQSNLIDHISIICAGCCNRWLRAIGTHTKHVLKRTSLFRGMLYCLRAFSITSSDLPLEYTSVVSHGFKPTSYACLRSGKAATSSMTHSCHSGLPKDIAPKTTLEILRPELPSLVYSILGVVLEDMSLFVCEIGNLELSNKSIETSNAR